MWKLPRPGIEMVSPALAGKFLITGPPGKSPYEDFGGSMFFGGGYVGLLAQPVFPGLSPILRLFVLFKIYFIDVHWFIALCKFHKYSISNSVYPLLTTKNVVCIDHHIVDLLYPFPFSSPTAPVVISTLFCLCFCLSWFIYCLFISFLYYTYEWNHMVFVFLHLACFT